jgi:hypothetical protein
MSSKKLRNFIEKLKEREHSDIVFNPYKNERQRINLKTYFRYVKPSSKTLLLGEASGYNGCRHSGIAFTSGEILYKNKLFSEIRKKLSFQEIKDKKEYSANIVYSFFSKYPPLFRKVLFFNVFPFHPHESNLPETNRKPSTEELNEGKKHLLRLFDLFKVDRYYPIGRVAEKVLNELKSQKEIPKFNYNTIRHPSYGGANKFRRHLMDIFNLRDTSLMDFMS